MWFDANDLEISVSATNALVAFVVYICSKRLQLTVGSHELSQNDKEMTFLRSFEN